MKKIKSSLNFVLCYFLIFTIFSLWATFYLKNKTFALILSAVFSLAIYLVLKNFLNSKEQTKTQTEQNKKELENFKVFLNSLLADETNNFLKLIFKEKIEINKQNCLIFNKNVLIIPCFSAEITTHDVFSACQQAKELNLNKIAFLVCKNDEKMVLFCNSISNFEIEIVSAEKLFELAKKENISYENIIKFKNKTKLTFKTILCLIFAKKNAKKFLFFGILSLFISFLTIFKLYYYIFCSLFFLMSLICIFRPKENSKNSLVF